MVATCSITTQNLAKNVQRGLVAGAKIWCLYVCFCHALRPARCSFERVYFEQVLCRCLWVAFDAVFSVFSEDDDSIVLIFVAR